MRSYLAAIWDDCGPLHAAGRQFLNHIRGTCGVRADVSLPGFELYELSSLRAGASVVPLRTDEGSQGAVFGTLYRKRGAPSRSGPFVPDTDEIDQIVKGDGLPLITDYWGSYVAFIRGRSGVHVLTDPTSALPCYYLQRPGLLLVFSHLEKCAFLERIPFTINHDFLAAVLCYDKIQTGETGLTEVSELPGGTRLTYRGGNISLEPVWDPRTFAADVWDPPQEQAAGALREMTLDVVGARAGTSGSVSMRLSGGLDSSIVLACTRRHLPGPELNALHHVLQSGDAPERRYAGLAAQQAACDLFCIDTPVVARLPAADTHPLTARPHRSAAALDPFALYQEVGHPIGNAVFTGQGGDHLFLDSRNALGFADHLRQHGLSRESRNILHGSARLAGTTVWAALAQGLPYALGRQPESLVLASLRQRQDAAYANPASLARIAGSLPGWVTAPGDLPPGKFQQVNHLFHLIHVREMTDASGNRELVHPLISQPLIELCLRLPVYRLCPSGTSRGLARVAFRDMIPEEIRCRTTKGSASRYYADTVSGNRQALVETLMDGELVREGLLDRRWLADFLRPDLAGIRPLERLGLVFYAVEIWLARWKSFLRQQSATR